MKKLLFLMSFGAFAACGGSTADGSNTDSTTVDTTYNGTVLTDTAATNSMNADTTGMGNAR